MRHARWLALWTAVAGCSSGPRRIVGDGAVLSAVAADQRFVAVLAGTTRLSDGRRTGALEAVPVSGGKPIVLDADSAGGRYARGSNLWFLGGVTVVDEGAPPVPHVWGKLMLWLPGLAEPALLGNRVRAPTVSQNGAGCVFMDWDQPSSAPGTTGRLAAASAAACGAGACQPITLAQGVTAAQADWRISDDGRWVLATVRAAAPAAAGKVLLLDLASGQLQQLSQAPAPRAPMMTPSGDTVAWVEGANQLRVAAIANLGAPATLTTAAPVIESAQMIDAGTFVAKTVAGTNDLAAALTRISAAGEAPIDAPQPLEIFVSQAVPGQTDRYLFYSQVAQSSGTEDVWLLDLQTPGAQPVQLGQAVAAPLGASLAFSDDGTAVRYLDAYDATTRRGDAYVAMLAAPTRNLVAAGVREAAFVPGTTRLLYIDAPDPATDAGVLRLWTAPGEAPKEEGVGLLDFASSRTSPRRTYYTLATGRSDDGVWSMRQP